MPERDLEESLSGTEISDKRIIVGKISGYYGVKGWLKLYSYTQPRENIIHYQSLQIKLGGDWKTVSVDAGKAHGKGVIAHFAGYDDRDAVAGLIGSELAVNRSQLSASAEDEFYWTDLIGLKVINTQGVHLGKVLKLIETAAHDVLVISLIEAKGETEKQILIPFVFDHYISEVNLASGIIIVDWDADWD